jgi:hypothetical protein
VPAPQSHHRHVLTLHKALLLVDVHKCRLAGVKLALKALEVVVSNAALGALTRKLKQLRLF